MSKNTSRVPAENAIFPLGGGLFAFLKDPNVSVEDAITSYNEKTFGKPREAIAVEFSAEELSQVLVTTSAK